VAGAGGRLGITLHAAWIPTRYAVEAIRELATVTEVEKLASR